MDAFAIKQGQNGIVQPLLTDLYQITMAYAYWKSGKTHEKSVFDLFFRKSPFQGEFTIFAGLEECLKFLKKFHFSCSGIKQDIFLPYISDWYINKISDIEYLKQALPSNIDNEFFVYLSTLTANEVTVYSMEEGSVAFPRVPLMRIEGPLIVVQLLETTFLTLINYASLMATNAARYRIAAGELKLLEFGLRRAQGPDGGLSASKYSYIGGFDGTSNVLAGKLFGIPVRGTHAHAYITSFTGFSELSQKMLISKSGGEPQDLLELAMNFRQDLVPMFQVVESEINNGELTALTSFAIAFPNEFVALVDTYDVKRSGLLNFCSVALALNILQYRALGIRIDSGDLAYLSNIAREYFIKVGDKYGLSWFRNLTIMASNDISEETIVSLNEQGHNIDCFAIGTHLVTCQRQPALGCVYKLVELNNLPRIKLSQDVVKVTIPGKKDVYRLYSESGHALIDLLQKSTENEPKPGEKVLCRHPFQESKRAFVIPSKVEKLHKIYWKSGVICRPLPPLEKIRSNVQASLKTLRTDIKRNLNPTPFKVSVSDQLYNYLHDLWLESAPIVELV